MGLQLRIIPQFLKKRPQAPPVVTSVEQAISLLLGDHFHAIWCREADQTKLPGPQYPMGLWFRGQADATWKLLPGVFRSASETPTLRTHIDEASTSYHFKLRLPAYSHDCHSTFDWLSLMQHHSLPTRLLDWTESILVALFFAVAEEGPFWEKDGKLFALEARKLNKLCGFDMLRPELAIPEELDTVLRAEMAVTHRLDRLIYRKAVTDAALSYLPEGPLGGHQEIIQKIESDSEKAIRRLRSPVAVFPRRLHGRMTFQSNMFTLHGGKILRKRRGSSFRLIPEPIHLEEINAGRKKGDAPILEEFLVPWAAKKEIKKHLQWLGIHEGSLFPEPDFQARYVRRNWTFPNDSEDS